MWKELGSNLRLVLICKCNWTTQDCHQKVWEVDISHCSAQFRPAVCWSQLTLPHEGQIVNNPSSSQLHV